jgi:molybdopterin molybdotransferase
VLVHDHSERITEQTDVHSPHRALTWDEARTTAHRAASVTPPEPVALPQALDRVLAEPLRAVIAVPPVDCSAMDGYAVCGPPPWSVIAQVRAGDGVPKPLRPGTACEVATGAPVPQWTTGVLPYEQARRAGELVSGRVGPGQHVRHAGEECAAGDEVLPAGALLGPAGLGLVAALGHDIVRARRAPRVGAIVTGNELLDAGIPAPGQVRDAIGPMLPGLTAWAGGHLHATTPLADSTALLVAALRAAEGEVILVSGSSSRGPADHLRTALVALRAELVVDGVACRPGHPQALARLPGGQLVVGLPGNPLAAFVAFLTLALPAITGLLGRPLAVLAPASPLPGSPGVTRLVPVRVRGRDIEALPHARSAMLRGMAAADALAVIAPSGETRLHPLPGPS